MLKLTFMYLFDLTKLFVFQVQQKAGEQESIRFHGCLNSL